MAATCNDVFVKFRTMELYSERDYLTLAQSRQITAINIRFISTGVTYEEPQCPADFWATHELDSAGHVLGIFSYRRHGSTTLEKVYLYYMCATSEFASFSVERFKRCWSLPELHKWWAHNICQSKSYLQFMAGLHGWMQSGISAMLEQEPSTEPALIGMDAYGEQAAEVDKPVHLAEHHDKPGHDDVRADHPVHGDVHDPVHGDAHEGRAKQSAAELYDNLDAALHDRPVYDAVLAFQEALLHKPLDEALVRKSFLAFTNAIDTHPVQDLLSAFCAMMFGSACVSDVPAQEEAMQRWQRETQQQQEAIETLQRETRRQQEMFEAHMMQLQNQEMMQRHLKQQQDAIETQEREIQRQREVIETLDRKNQQRQKDHDAQLQSVVLALEQEIRNQRAYILALHESRQAQDDSCQLRLDSLQLKLRDERARMAQACESITAWRERIARARGSGGSATVLGQAFDAADTQLKSILDILSGAQK